ncbi:hypothetical protein ACS0ZG_15060 [Burkholderia gladioli]|uniref:hypothetical protein n=1 Tax=Burkholderia gladioli TaxID=28095 RepID=UPI00164219D4|nr:hypothetical protein [Burkholderia gladioli]
MAPLQPCLPVADIPDIGPVGTAAVFGLQAFKQQEVMPCWSVNVSIASRMESAR